MILIIIAILLGVAGLFWLWKGPVAKSADSLQEGGSSKSESYILVVLLALVLSAAVYMIVVVV